jgi:hypothetical protein
MSETCGLDYLLRVQGRMSETRDIMCQARGRFSQKLVGITCQARGQKLVDISAASARGTRGGKVRNLCLDTEMSDRIFSGSKSQRTVWDAGETKLQGGKMQGSGGSTSISFH